MNKSQKILTLVFLLAFVATLIWFPLRNNHGWGSTTWTGYGFFMNVNPHVYFNWSQVVLEWIGLFVIYRGLLAVLR